MLMYWKNSLCHHGKSAFYSVLSRMTSICHADPYFPDPGNSMEVRQPSKCNAKGTNKSFFLLCPSVGFSLILHVYRAYDNKFHCIICYGSS